ncbi:pitrilysin family protein [Clostridium sp. MB40-C1]|uniref:M16 family metallopeptidase n=1 Tax=Clostridium sp. MB40-C1 TaxID=3070996 RepID=UPI0027DFC6B6|nr:pitrilysin family protein [Clostridium sp. MB40-C1]WMJ82167.1 pitrilysin family protein [Clostridium sp. MB40-C1]
MIEYKMKNGINVQYIKRSGNITSFCIGFNAGALVEDDKELGLAHVVEHMVFKGTENRTEEEINKSCDEIFGFHNAMTNYPYVIYYGTSMSSDFEEGFETYSDIILNPLFNEEGFKEEKAVILEELKEWKDDTYQNCEDELFYNSFNKRRIKNLIIGTEKSIKSFTVADIKNFYKKHYSPMNCVISVVSSLEFREIKKIIEKYFDEFENDYIYDESKYYESNNEGVFYKIIKGLNGAKVQYCFSIHELNDEEVKLLKIFNHKFGEGISSILYDEIRTKYGLVYDISSSIKNEKGIKLFTIRLGTSNDNVDKVIKIINKKIEEIKDGTQLLNMQSINKIIKNINLKRELSLERSIELAKNLTTHKIMYNSVEAIFSEFDNVKIEENKILSIVKKVLNSPSIQVLTPQEKVLVNNKDC